LWHYVWTRDLSYAAALGLGMLDPRARATRWNSSWPATATASRPPACHRRRLPDRAGHRQRRQLAGQHGPRQLGLRRGRSTQSAAADERRAFAAKALHALRNTLENDRIAVWDAADGLYTGEESFLDWREQSYAAWMPNELSFMATSKALSTNAAHYKALTLAAQLAGTRQRRWRSATRLGCRPQAAINKRFWQADSGMYSSVTAGHFDGAALYKYDWLGQSLAIITGIADQSGAEHSRALSAWSAGRAGDLAAAA
jgi:hypothetical protein